MPVLQDDIRQQVTFGTLDEMVATNSVARVIDVLIDKADLSPFGFKFKGKSKVGRPAYMVSRMAKLYIYGYLNKIRSSHKLADACGINLEIKWLINGERPCQKTISAFRATNTEGIGNLLIWFNEQLANFGLFETDVYSIDSAIIAGQNSRQNNYSDKRIAERLEQIEKEVSQYLLNMESDDKRYDWLLEQKVKYKELARNLKKSSDHQISTTDPDTRLLKKGAGCTVGYNLQSSVDGENHLIACVEVTNKGDSSALHSVATKTKEVTGHGAIRVLADKGYDNGAELNKCACDGIETYVSPKSPKKKTDQNKITKADFHYHSDHDQYVCPAGKQLSTNGKDYTMNSHRVGRTSYKFKIYELPFSQCKDCPYLQDCMTSKAIKDKRNRTIQRSEHEDHREANAERVKENKELYKRRKAIVEHPFGTIKRGWGYHYTLLKGLEKVQAEYELIAIAYNLRRAMSIFGNLGLIERIGALLNVFLQIFRLTRLYPAVCRVQNYATD